MTDERHIAPNGIHHLAFSTGNAKAQIDFFTDVLGAELKAFYWMHVAGLKDVERCWHAFLKLNDTCYVAFVEGPSFKEIKPIPGVSHAPNAAMASAPGTVGHVALSCASESDLLALRDRIRSRGILCLGPLDHGFCKSIYFAGPEGINLEVATSPEPIDERAWIDPEVVTLAGITQTELESYIRPARYKNDGPPIAQPPFDPSKPHPNWSKERMDAVLKLSDAEVTATLSITDPPVKLDA